MHKPPMKSNYQTIIFIHLYKSAGTTLYNIASRQYKRNEYWHFDPNHTLNSFLNLTIEQRNEIKFIAGHLKFGIHSYTKRNCKYFTFVRDPVTRIISLYNYINKTKDLDLHKLIPSNERENIIDFIENIDKYSPLHGNNGQTKMIAGMDFCFPDKNNLWDKKIKNQLVNLNNVYEQAMDNIEKHFFFIGITEYFDESLILLKKYLGWNYIYYIPRNVTNTKVKNFDDKIINKIKEKNKLDAKLYIYMKEKFELEMNKNLKYIILNKKYLSLNNFLYKNYRKIKYFLK